MILAEIIITAVALALLGISAYLNKRNEKRSCE